MDIRVPLGLSRFALVSAEDAQVVVDGRRWGINSKGYVRSATLGTTLHRVVMNCQFGDGRVIDHISGDKLDCRRTNLRESSAALNAQNKRMHRNNTSGYRGVYYSKANYGWVAQAKLGGVTYYLGTFPQADLAHLAVSEWRAENMEAATA